MTERLGHKPTDQQLVTYLQHPNDAVNSSNLKRNSAGSMCCRPAFFFAAAAIKLGETLIFKDHDGKEHMIEIGPAQENEDTHETSISLNVDHHQREYVFLEEKKQAEAVAKVTLSKEEIAELARVGDVRAPFSANVCEVVVGKGQKVEAGDRLVILEAMKMQTPILSEVAGVIESIGVELGKSVQPGDKLVKIVAEK